MVPSTLASFYEVIMGKSHGSGLRDHGIESRLLATRSFRSGFHPYSGMWYRFREYVSTQGKVDATSPAGMSTR